MRCLKIGTRGSPLARKQGKIVSDMLSEVSSEFLIYSTTGDRLLDKPLIDFGGKGLFTKELDEALLNREIDCAVHSAKDLPANLPNGIVLAAILSVQDRRDTFLGYNGLKFSELPYGAIIGTASLRRSAQVKRVRPDIQTELLRGNVGTRISKLNSGIFSGTILAAAGIARLQLKVSHELLSLNDFPPAAGQGILAVTARADDTQTLDILSPLSCADSSALLLCERSFLKTLQASCRMSISCYSYYEHEKLYCYAKFYAEDPQNDSEYCYSGAKCDAELIGAHTAKALFDLSPELRVLLSN